MFKSVIVGYSRSPFTIAKKGALIDVKPDELLSEVIKDLLVKQIYSPVKWRESIINIKKLGVKNFIELGPGKALTGMVKRTVKDVNCYTINSVSDIKNVQNELKE